MYTAKVSTSKLSTKFEDWIEEDLLKISSWNVKEVLIDDYSVDEARGVLSRRGRMKLAYNDTGDTKWEMLEDVAFEGEGRPTARQMAEDEELDTSKLDDMRKDPRVMAQASDHGLLLASLRFRQRARPGGVTGGTPPNIPPHPATAFPPAESCSPRVILLAKTRSFFSHSVFCDYL